MNKFTPGPYRALAEPAWFGFEARFYTVTDAEGVIVAFCKDWMDGPQPEANAKLFAAAPDLLKTLERIARPHDCGCVPCTGSCTSETALQITVDEIRELARSAIGRATA